MWGVERDVVATVASVGNEEMLEDGGCDEVGETSPLVNRRSSGRSGSSHSNFNVSNDMISRHDGSGETEIVSEERSPLVDMLNMESRRERERSRGNSSEKYSQGIRLGLGDFVFYSVLVGRAAMYDLMTVYPCYLAIICGLGCTLILLSVCRRALPALPIAITLGDHFLLLDTVVNGTVCGRPPI